MVRDWSRILFHSIKRKIKDVVDALITNLSQISQNVKHVGIEIVLFLLTQTSNLSKWENIANTAGKAGKKTGRDDTLKIKKPIIIGLFTRDEKKGI